VRSKQSLACVIAILTGGACDGRDLAVATVGDITIENPYAPEPVTPDVGSLYFSLHNDGALPDRLISVAVNLANDVSLHGQERLGNSMRMVAVDSIEVPPHGSVSLEPGGFHAMLRELSRHYRQGDSLFVTVHLAKASPVTFWAPVISYVDVADRIKHGLGEGQH